MNEEHQTIYSKVELMEANMNGKFALMNQTLDGVRQDAIEIKDLLMGDNSIPGMVTRVDRLEQDRKKQIAFHAVWGAGFIGMIIKYLENKLGL